MIKDCGISPQSLYIIRGFMREKWVLTAKGADFHAIGEKFHIDPVIARLIRNRDIVGDEAIEVYLNGGLEQMHAPWLLKDMGKAVDILTEKIREKKRIRIIGDYDIDGICATYILKKGFERLNATADYDIPDRMRDGYGINRHLIDEAKKTGIDTIVTCDNGISAREEIAYAKSLGMTVIVTDHHDVPFQAEEGKPRYLLPPADAVINQKQADCPYPYKGICGAMVACRLVEALFEKAGIEREALYPLLMFGAIATIGDVMDLTGENRIIVKAGLALLRKTEHKGLTALIRVNHLIPAEISAYHIGFVLGPCLNASGRLDSAKRALRLLQAEDESEALRLAEDLKVLNDSRKLLTEEAVEAALQKIEAGGTDRDRVLVVYLPDCHESIAGIVAGRIREVYRQPVFVITEGEQSLKGSGRSIPAYSMFEKLQECRDLLLHFGGHPMAAGLSIEAQHLAEFRKRLNENCGLTEADFTEKISIDMEMPVGYITEKLVGQLSLLEPFGKGNEKPLFAEKNLHVEHAELVGKRKNVLKMTVSDGYGQRVSAVCFREAEKAYAYVQTHKTITAAYYPQINEFRGQSSIQIVITNYY